MSATLDDFPQEWGGCCGDDAFFEQLDAEWTEVGASPHHVTWWGIHCRLLAFRRAESGDRTPDPTPVSEPTEGGSR